ncbi:hypothetical protein WJX72_001457 [[Myrmecia] bisecta]|uniref:F-box domain-containing protein n=1 Tax=[Myrmecia] bisecta TaxID=41462 RepID=A0AAW1Q3F5_9CHLO
MAESAFLSQPKEAPSLQCERRCLLTSLPNEILREICRHLKAGDLARLCVQDTQLYELAGERDLWQPFCVAKWQQCDTPGSLLMSPAIYNDNWRALYSARMSMPPGLPICVDKLHALQLSAAATQSGTIVQRLFTESMQALFSIGLAVNQDKTLKASRDYKLCLASLIWWLRTHPEVIIAYVRQTNAALQEYDMWSSGFVNWAQIPSRRSAIAFLQAAACSAQPWEHASLLQRLEIDVGHLDYSIRSVEEESENLGVRIPAGVPAAHWWFWLSGRVTSTRSC